MKILFKKLHPDAITPSRGSPWSVGYDICSLLDTTIQPWESACISTGVAIEPTCELATDEWKQTTQGLWKPEFYIRVAPRSGLAVKNINVHAGVVDPDYRGEVKVILFNHNPHPFKIHAKDRIAQLIVERAVLNIEWEECDILGDTSRGQNGFGSTGN